MQMMPVVGCITGAHVALMVLCIIGPPIMYMTTDRYNVSPQGIVLFTAVAGSVGCLVTCLAIPRYTRRFSSKGRAVKALKRMNLLGLVRVKMQQHDLAIHMIRMFTLASGSRTGDTQFKCVFPVWYNTRL